MILPFTSGLKLSRANEMLLGVLLPFTMLIIYEAYAWYKGKPSNEYIECNRLRKKRKEQAMEARKEEAFEIKKQNRFGLNVIAFSLFFYSITPLYP